MAGSPIVHRTSPHSLVPTLDTRPCAQAPWLLLIETDYVWMHPLQAPRAEDGSAASLAFHFDYIRPSAPNLEKVQPWTLSNILGHRGYTLDAVSQEACFTTLHIAQGLLDPRPSPSTLAQHRPCTLMPYSQCKGGTLALLLMLLPLLLTELHSCKGMRAALRATLQR